MPTVTGEDQAMYMMVLKASLLIVVIIAVLGALQTEPITDLMVVFVAGGVIPGTNLVIPAQVILVTVGMAVMMLAALFFRAQARHQANMRTLMPEYEQDQERQDPSYTALVPGLSKAQAMGRMLRTYFIHAAPQLYLWLRRVGRQLRARTPAMQKTLRVTAARVDRWTTGHVIHAYKATRKWRSFVLRVTTF